MASTSEANLPTSSEPDSPVAELLATAVGAIGGAERSGQTVMARAVWDSVNDGTHLAVQAGTGTGKSLAYLVPAMQLAADRRGPVVVSTATIALQRQLVDRDLPTLAAALREPLGRTPEFAILKGRNNYLCLNKLRNGPEDEQDSLFDALGGQAQTSQLGAHIKRLHQWAATTSSGDRDEMVPGVPDQAWRQVSVTARECLGPGRCPFGVQCFSERARRMAAEADVIVTNHALLAIDTLGEGGILPEHRVVIVDEAHELVDRVTSVATGELSGYAIDFAVRRTGKLVDDAEIARLSEAGNALTPLLATMPAGRMDQLDLGLGATLAALRDAAMACAARVRKIAGTKDDERRPRRGHRRTDRASRARGDRGDRGPDDRRLRPADRRSRGGRLAGAARGLVGQHAAGVAARRAARGRARCWPSTCSRTRPSCSPRPRSPSAVRSTPLARQWGLDADAMGTSGQGIDVGSPFAHGRSGILYVAKHLPPPSRDGLPPEYLDELWELIEAAGGRTLGLFSSMRAARAAAAALRECAAVPGAVPGRRLDRAAGQGVRGGRADVPVRHAVAVAGRGRARAVAAAGGHRPDPVPPAGRPAGLGPHRAADARGGNGFMEVSATHAALLLAQGAGRLLRSMDDRGVVAVLDPRLVTKRYGEYLRASLPPFWQTTDPKVVRGALERLAAS